MEPIRKILLGGDIGTGKDSLVDALLKVTPLPVTGLRTIRLNDEIDPETKGAMIYMYPANVSFSDYPKNEENNIGSCTGRVRRIHPHVFRELGMKLLSDIPDNHVIVIDEIGFFEADVKEYTDRIFEILKGENFVIAVVKTRYEDPFLSAVKNDPDAHYFDVKKENRQKLLDSLSGVVRTWK